MSALQQRFPEEAPTAVAQAETAVPQTAGPAGIAGKSQSGFWFV